MVKAYTLTDSIQLLPAGSYQQRFNINILGRTARLKSVLWNYSINEVVAQTWLQPGNNTTQSFVLTVGDIATSINSSGVFENFSLGQPVYNTGSFFEAYLPCNYLFESFVFDDFIPFSMYIKNGDAGLTYVERFSLVVEIEEIGKLY